MPKSVTCFFTRQTAAVQITEDFPYEGSYLTEENRINRRFIFEERSLKILLRREDLQNAETKNTDGNTLKDDFGVVYTKHDQLPDEH